MRPNRQQRRAAVAEARTRRSWDWFKPSLTDAARARHPACADVLRVLRNDIYVVQIYGVPWRHYHDPLLHLIVRRIDGGKSFPWRDLQRIKDELVSPDRTAVQVHPPDYEVVDQANLAHLWVYPSGFSLDFGLAQGKLHGLR